MHRYLYEMNNGNTFANSNWEPSDDELAEIWKEAADEARHKWLLVRARFFEQLKGTDQPIKPVHAKTHA